MVMLVKALTCAKVSSSKLSTRLLLCYLMDHENEQALVSCMDEDSSLRQCQHT